MRLIEVNFFLTPYKGIYASNVFLAYMEIWKFCNIVHKFYYSFFIIYNTYLDFFLNWKKSTKIQQNIEKVDQNSTINKFIFYKFVCNSTKIQQNMKILSKNKEGGRANKFFFHIYFFKNTTHYLFEKKYKTQKKNIFILVFC